MPPAGVEARMNNRYGFHRLGIIVRFVNSAVSLVLGLSGLIGGLALTILALVNQPNWITISLFGFSSSVYDATLGIFLIVGGSFVLVTNRDLIFFLILMVCFYR